MLYFLQIFSLVIPIGVNILLICSFSKLIISSDKSFLSSIFLKLLNDIDSTPPAIYILPSPEFIELFALIIACRPLLHNLFTVYKGTDFGIPEIYSAARLLTNPPISCKAFPIIISSINSGFSDKNELREINYRNFNKRRCHI